MAQPGGEVKHLLYFYVRHRGVSALCVALSLRPSQNGWELRISGRLRVVPERPASSVSTERVSILSLPYKNRLEQGGLTCEEPLLP